MRSEDDLVKILRASISESDFIFCGYTANRISRYDLCFKRSRNFFDVLARAINHSSPWVLGIETEEAVVEPEAHQSSSWEIVDSFWRRRPHRSGHRGEIPI